MSDSIKLEKIAQIRLKNKRVICGINAEKSEFYFLFKMLNNNKTIRKNDLILTKEAALAVVVLINNLLKDK